MEVSSLVAVLQDMKDCSRRLDILRALDSHLAKPLTSSDCAVILGQFDRNHRLEALRVLAQYLDGLLDADDLMTILMKFDCDCRLDVLLVVFSNWQATLTTSDFLLISKELEKAHRVDGFYVMHPFLSGPIGMSDVLVILYNFDTEGHCLKVMETLISTGLFKPSSDCLAPLAGTHVLSPGLIAVYEFLVGKLESVETQVVKNVLATLSHQSQQLSVLAMTEPKMTELSTDDVLGLLKYFSVENEHHALSHIINKVAKMSRAEFLSICYDVSYKCRELLETKVKTEAGILVLLEALRDVSDKHKVEIVQLLAKDYGSIGDVTENDLKEHFETKESLDACCQLLGIETKRVYDNPTILIVDTRIEKSSLENNTQKVISLPEAGIFAIVTLSTGSIDLYVQYRQIQKQVKCSADSSITVKDDGKVFIDGVTIYH